MVVMTCHSRELWHRSGYVGIRVVCFLEIYFHRVDVLLTCSACSFFPFARVHCHTPNALTVIELLSKLPKLALF